MPMLKSTYWRKGPRKSLAPTVFSKDKLIIVEDWLFTQKRFWLYGSGVTVAYAIGLLVRLVTHTWLFQDDGKSSCIDFSHFWVSSAFARSQDPALVYDFLAFSAARSALGGTDACMVINHFVYPPTYLFVTYYL